MHLLYEDGNDPMELLRSDKLNEMMDKFIEFCSLNIRNLVSSLKHCPTSQDYLSNIMSFKYKIGYDYIQDNYFPNEFGEKMFIFKMSMHIDVSGFDLV
jgi:hypothetical protein